ncbi:ATPase/protein kinase [Bacteroidia bacterium]|nr:ATPase/protein kinase [Bacteroidia bacterium]
MKHQDGSFDSALSERAGIVQPGNVNPYYISKRETGGLQTKEYYMDGILKGNRSVLGRAITLIESQHPDHQTLAQEIIECCLPHTGKSVRLGITGVPGAGKSTVIETLGVQLVKKGSKLAVLAVDPSSERSKGSILGDKTRMEELSGMENAFIRPSPSAGSLGGVTRKTSETIVLCEAAGFDTIFVETVGVGQSETAVYNMVDFFLLVQIANAGDELQGIKRGIMEMADMIVINKADGDNIQQSKLAKSQFANALHLFPPTESGWIPPVETCSAYTGDNIDKLWQTVQEYVQYTKNNGYFEHNRRMQKQRTLKQSVEEMLLYNFYNDPVRAKQLEIALNDVVTEKISPYIAAQKLIHP